jgi:hypothetical protein
MRKENIPKVAPLIRDHIVWQAFLALIEFEKKKCVDKLEGKLSQEDLVRLNAEYSLLNRLSRARDVWLNVEIEDK